MEKKKYSALTWFKFVVLSALGIWIFFVNVTVNGSKAVPMLQVINIVKKAVPAQVNTWLVVLICLFTLATAIAARFSKKKDGWLKSHHGKDGVFAYFTFVTAAIFAVMVVLNVGPQFVIDPTVGTSSVNVVRDVLYAGIIAGTLVVFLTEFGLLDFIGILLEPIMRKLFKVPGKASIDALSSFVCAPAVGVMITNNLYKNKTYTAREACMITTSFSICSLGAYAFLSGMANCSEYYSQMILTSLILVFVMAAIMVRIPPLSKKPDIYYDGEVQTEEMRQSGAHYDMNGFLRDKADYTMLVRELTSELKKLPEVKPRRAVALTGIALDTERVLRCMEENGFAVTADMLAQESLQVETLVPENGSALERIAAWWSNVRCSSLTLDEKKLRADKLVELVSSGLADGIIVAMPAFCDPEEYDYPILCEVLQQKGVAQIGLELSGPSGCEQACSRIQAFAEMFR